MCVCVCSWCAVNAMRAPVSNLHPNRMKSVSLIVIIPRRKSDCARLCGLPSCQPWMLMNTSGTVQRDDEEGWKQCLESEGCLENGAMKRVMKCAALLFMGLLENCIWPLELFWFSRENVANNQRKTSPPDGTALQTLSCGRGGICTDLCMVF